MTGSDSSYRADSADSADSAAAIRLANVSRDFRVRRTSLTAPPQVVHALRDVSLSVSPGSRYGVVGESGSGKTTLLRLIAGLDSPTSGTVQVYGADPAGSENRSGKRRRNPQMVFQDPFASLDPRMRIADVVAEPLIAAGVLPVHERVREVLNAVQLDPAAARRYPHQFSGGQRQRISIARALAAWPSILLADEAVSALDVSTRGQILDLLGELSQTRGFTLVFVSHDLSVVHALCDEVAVLRRGELVESGPVASVYANPQHPYTRELLAAVPTIAGGLARARDRQARSATLPDAAGSLE